ncbi:MAG: hypothetical protein HYY38_04010, partial [Rhodospirillales bacterium]|nr:hypothetical protein [Rhodospirillales bacterium]
NAGDGLTGGINVGLSSGGTLNFFIGAGGNTQLSSNDTGSLKTTGALVLGRATTAGDNGLGLNAQTLTVNSITNQTASPIQLSPDSGSSFQLIAGAGGILLDRSLTSFQDTIIDTTGPLTINQTLGTSNNDLTITAASVTLGANGSINTGSGTFTCTGTGCNTILVNPIFWDGGGAADTSWFNALNWNTDTVPTTNNDVTIGTGFGTIQISTGGPAEARSLIAGSPLQLSSGSLTLVNASQFNHTFTFSSTGSLSGTGSVAVSGPNGALTWSGGSMASGGTFLLASGRSGTLSNMLTLDRLFQNDGTLTLSGATVNQGPGVTGSITNVGTMSVSGSTLSVPITNSSPVQFTAGTNIVTATSGITGGMVEFTGGTTTFQTGSTYSVDTTNISGGTANFDNTASTTDLNLSSGTLGGTGDLTVNTGGAWSGGQLTGAGTLTVAAPATWTLNGGTKFFGSRTLVNNGTLDWTVGGVEVNGDGAFTNAGAFNIVGDLNWGDAACCGIGTTTMTNTATGTIAKTAGAGTAFLGSDNAGNIGSVVMNNNGTLSVGANLGTLRLHSSGSTGNSTGAFNVGTGSTLEFFGGTHNLNAGSNVTGAGTVAFTGATVNVGGAYSPATTAISAGTANFNAGAHTTTTFNLSGGTLGGTGDLTVNTGGAWSGGQLTGAGTLTVAAPATWTLNGGTKFFG